MSELSTDRTNSVLQLTLNRPDQANALSPNLVEGLLTELADLDDIRLVVIRGEGRNFCGGFDLSDIAQLSDGDLLWRFVRIELLLQAVAHAPVPTVALAQRHIVGAGADLFAACTHRVADSSARFRMPGWNFELGLGTRRLAALVGSDAARDMLIDTRSVTVEEARAMGLVNEVVEPDGWDAVVDGWAERAQQLSPKAVTDMLSLTRPDTRIEDLATIALTAGRPGLKQRIETYRAG